ncbi:MAG: Smr/MutS family protein [Paracoccaceae bacterium]
MTKRRLTPEDLELWRRVTEQTKRTQPQKKPQDFLGVPPKPIVVDAPRLAPFKIGSAARKAPLAHDILPSLSDRLAKTPVQMDRKAFGKMKRGKLVPEGKIDLHGMTLDQAHPALIRFIMSSQAAGKRLVLVVTGKGKSSRDDGPIPIRRGVLKHQVPQWLAAPPVGQVVMQIAEAHISHGGVGAYYVYLRKQR